MDKAIEELVLSSHEGFNHYQDALEYAEWMVNKIGSLPNEVTLYRVLKAPSKEEINLNFPGWHFTLFDEFDQHFFERIGMVWEEDYLPFKLKVTTKKENIDIRKTIEMNMKYPYEYEMGLKDPKQVRVISVEQIEWGIEDY